MNPLCDDNRLVPTATHEHLPQTSVLSGPSLLWMHGTLFLTGWGTLLLGPILPLLARQWHLLDAQSGLLILAQFCGSFCGGVTTSGRLRRSAGVGVGAATVGLAGFAFAPGLASACASLVIAGFGVGRTITAVNIMAGRRHPENRGVTLARLNFSWSAGALFSPLSAAWLASRFGLRSLLASFAGLFMVSVIVLFAQTRGQAAEVPADEEGPGQAGLAPPVFVYFVAILLLYGGLETCLGGWLTTYALRYGSTSSLVTGEYTLVLLLSGLTAGRAISAALLARVSERTLMRAALTLSAALSAALALAHSSVAIACFAVLLGLCLAPVFPAAFAIVLGTRPRARQAGLILAASAIGAAVLPWAMGVISTRSGSLQIALGIPVAAALALLALTLIPVKVAA